MGKSKLFSVKCSNCEKTYLKTKGSIERWKTKMCSECDRKFNSNRKKSVSKKFKTHGNSNTQLYKIFLGIKQRCKNINNKSYKDYGGRGIRCEWVKFEDFFQDMNNAYIEGLTIERIDVNGNYCKENCKWIPRSEQSKNRRGNHYIEFNGITLTLAEWARKLGIKRTTLRERINVYGWTVEKSFKLSPNYNNLC